MGVLPSAPSVDRYNKAMKSVHLRPLPWAAPRTQYWRWGTKLYVGALNRSPHLQRINKLKLGQCLSCLE